MLSMWQVLSMRHLRLQDLCRVTYLSKSGNATRLAGSLSAEELPDLARIASGQAKSVAENRVTEAVKPGAVTGGQGVVMKPMDPMTGAFS